MNAGHVITGDGCRIAYRCDGPDGAPVLLLSNSLGTDMDMWLPQLGSWSRRFRVLRYDHRGHGRSDAPPGAYSIDRLTRDVIELLDGLAIGQADFCGLSLGGMIGQALAIRAGERVRRLIVANTSACMGPASAWDARIGLVRKEGMAPLADASIQRWFTASFVHHSPDIAAVFRATLLAMRPSGYTGCCAAIRDMDMRRAIASVGVPALVIFGIRDPATPPAHAALLVNAIPGAASVALDAAHLSNVECADAFGRAVTDFLAYGGEAAEVR